MAGEEVCDGLRCIGIVRDLGRQYEAWAMPDRQGLGRFNDYQAACRAVFEHDRQRRREAP